MNEHPQIRLVSQDQLGLLIEAFLDDCELADLSVRTVTEYRKTLERFAWWVSESGRETDPATIRPIDIREFLRYVQSSPNRWGSDHVNANRPISPAGLDAYYRVLRRFFNWLTEQEYLQRSPMDKRVRRPRVVQQPVEPFTPVELTSLSNALRNQPDNEAAARDRAIAAVLLDVGLRASELVNLLVQDVDVMSGVIIVRHGKGRKTRTVQLGSSGRRAIRRYWIRFRSHEVEDEKEPFFVSRTGRALTDSGLRQLMERLGERAGVPSCRPHRWRHTFSITALRAGMGLLELQTILGHADLSMVKRYARIAETDIAKAAKEHSALDHLRIGL
jgi:site-specific recombinase XerD